MKSKPGHSSVEKGKYFEQAVRQLLELMGYEVSTNELIEGTQIDLVAQKSADLNGIRLMVECTDRIEPVGVPLVKEKSSILLARNPDYLQQLLYVSKNGFTAEAKAFARPNPAIRLLTLEELEGFVIDFSPYARWYLEHFDASTSIFAEGQLAERYVDLNCQPSDKDPSRPMSP